MVRVLAIWILCVAAGGASAAEKTLRLLTTFPPAYAFVANVVGELSHLENLLPSGASLHDFQLTPAEVRKMDGADIIFVNGLGVESFLDRFRTTTSKARFVPVTDGLDKELLKDANGVDPHVWLDPILVTHCVTNILNVLEKADPANAASYRRNAMDYLVRLRKLDEQLRLTLAPVKDVPFLTYHQAFRYFARRYDLSLAGVVEIVPDVAPSGRELSELHRTIREKHVKALFVEPGHTTRLATQISRDAGIKIGELDALETGELSARSYEAAMLRNAENLKKAVH